MYLMIVMLALSGNNELLQPPVQSSEKTYWIDSPRQLPVTLKDRGQFRYPSEQVKIAEKIDGVSTEMIERRVDATRIVYQTNLTQIIVSVCAMIGAVFPAILGIKKWKKSH